MLFKIMPVGLTIFIVLALAVITIYSAVMVGVKKDTEYIAPMIAGSSLLGFLLILS